MAKEIENLRQLSAQRDTFHSLAQKREKQHGLLGEQLGQGSITRDVRIAEVMERTLDRWGKVTERAESLGQALSEETESVNAQLQRLRDLGSRNPKAHTSYEQYQTELDAFRSGQAVSQTSPTQRATEPVPPPTTETSTPEPKPAAETSPEKTIYEVNLPDGANFQTGSKLENEFIGLLASAEKMSLGELAIGLYGEDTPENRSHVSAIRSRIKSKLSTFGWEATKEKDSEFTTFYRLKKVVEEEKTGGILFRQDPAELLDGSAESTEEQGEQKQEKTKQRRTLPNGVEIEISEGRTLEILDLIDQGVTSSGKLAFRVYGEDNPVNKNRIGATIGGQINRLLQQAAGLQLRNTVSRSDLNRGVPSHYVYEAIVHEGAQPTELSTKFRDVSPDVFNRLPTIATSQTSLGLAGITEVPYIPTAEELRTPEETRIVAAIAIALTKSQKIDFPLLQRALRTEERIRTLHGQRMYRPYQADELRRIFESGLKKLREESAGVNLREKWTDEDSNTWETTQKLVYRMTEDNNFDEYVRRTRKLIEESERTFREAHGNTPEWLNLENGGQQYESR